MKRSLCLLSIFTGLAIGVGCEQHPLPQAENETKPKAKEPVEQSTPAPTPEESPAPQFFPDR